jgi:processive 1,2-diacylglycerol beta-glucosyltransferase
MAVDNSNCMFSESETCSETAKKKIVVLISKGGGGHRAAGDSLKEILGKRYDVEVVNALSDMLRPIDTFSVLSFDKFTAEDLYNFFLRKGFHRCIEFFFCRFGFKLLRFRRKKIQNLFERYFEKRPAPDLVISTFPLINSALFVAAHNYDVPVVILPTDLDSESFLFGMDEVQIDEKAQLTLAMPYDDPDLQLKAIRESNLKQKHLFVTGFPVRPACLKKYQPEELKEIRKKHGMKEGMRTITLIMGAVGGDVLLKYTQELSKLKLLSAVEQTLQLNVCVGRNKEIAGEIRDWILAHGGKLISESQGYTTVESQEGVTIHIRGFTNEVIEIMACSEVIITKTGSCSVNEAIYLGKKLLVDNTELSSARHVWWESFNVSFVKKHNLGDAFSDIGELSTKTVTLLYQPTQSPSARGDFRLPSFEENVLTLVEKVL